MRGAANSYKAECKRLTEGIMLLPEVEEFENETKTKAIEKFAERIFELFPADKTYTTISRLTIKRIAAEIIPTDTSVSLVDGHIETVKGR